MLMLLLLRDDLSQLLSERIVAQSLSLPHTFAIVLYRFSLVIEIELKHFFRLIRQLYRLWRGRGHSAQIIDLISNDECMLQLFSRMFFQITGYAHPFSAFQYVAVDGVRDNRLVLTSKIFVECADQVL